MTNDIVDRLRRWTHSVDAAPASDLMDEAAGEIERLRSLTRFQDGVIRSGDVACLTEAERKAIADAADRYASITNMTQDNANHDAVPAATARTDADRNRTDKAALRPGKGAGDTPVTEPMPKEKRAEVSVRIDGPDQDSRVWETHTLPTQPTPGECSRPQEGTSEPAA